MSDDEDIDIQAILARINSNLDMEDSSLEHQKSDRDETTEIISIGEEESRISEDKSNNNNVSQERTIQNIRNQIFVVREDAETEIKTEDTLREQVKNITLVIFIAFISFYVLLVSHQPLRLILKNS